MIEAPFLGVALLKMASSPHDSGLNSTVEEFYVAIFGGRISPHKFVSYADAVAHYEKLFNAAQKHRKPGKRLAKIAELVDADVA